MKRIYISPEFTLVELDLEALMQATVTCSLGVNNPTDNKDDPREEILIEAASYRNTLWK